MKSADRFAWVLLGALALLMTGRAADVSFDATSLCPRPQSVSGSWAARVAIDERLEVRVTCPDPKAPGWLAEHFATAFGVRPRVVRTTSVAASGAPGGYALAVTSNALAVTAADAAGVRHAFFTLRQAALRTRGGLASGRYMLPLLEVTDAPAFPLRAMHLCWMPEMKPNRIEHLIRLAALYKFNVVVLEPWGTWRSARHPWYGWKDASCNAASVGHLRAVAADLGVTLVPQINVFGHAGASRGDVGKHAVLDFAPEYAPLFEPRNGWNWCLSNPETQKVVADLVTELHALFGKPPYFHLGCDEARKPSCPDCRAAPSYGKLVADHVAGLCRHVEKLGARPMLWHDMMLKSGDPRWKGFYANGTDETVALLDRLPRLAIVCDWCYGAPPRADGDYPSYRHFKSQGFEVLSCPWFGAKSIPAMGVAARRAGLGGMLVTTWNYPYGMMLFNSYALGATAAWRADGANGGDRDVFFDHFRLTGQDMGWKDYAETGVWDEQVPRDNAYRDGWNGITFPQWVE